MVRLEFDDVGFFLVPFQSDHQACQLSLESVIQVRDIDFE